MTSNTIVTMTMASHSSHATAVTTSAIPVGKLTPFYFTVHWNPIVCFTSRSHCLHLSVFILCFNQHLFWTVSWCLFTAKVVPQPIAHSTSRVQPDYPGERANLIPIPGHRSSPNPVTMEARSDNRWAHDVGELHSIWGKSQQSIHLISIISL